MVPQGELNYSRYNCQLLFKAPPLFLCLEFVKARRIRVN